MFSYFSSKTHTTPDKYPSNQVNTSLAYKYFLNYMHSKTSYLSTLKPSSENEGSGPSILNISRFAISTWLFNQLNNYRLNNATTEEHVIQLFLKAAATANELSESQYIMHKHYANLDKIIDTYLDWTNKCNDCLEYVSKDINAKNPAIIYTHSILFKIFDFENISQLSQLIFSLYDILLKNDPKDTQAKNLLQIINLNDLRKYCLDKSSLELGESDGPNKSGACKYFLAKWLVTRLDKLNWDDQDLNAILIAASNTNQTLESNKSFTTLHNLQDICSLYEGIFKTCENELDKVQANLKKDKLDADSIIEDDLAKFDFTIVQSEPTPSPIISNSIFGSKSALSRHICQLYNGIQDYKDNQQNKNSVYIKNNYYCANIIRPIMMIPPSIIDHLMLVEIQFFV